MWKQRTDRGEDFIVMGRGKMVCEGVKWIAAELCGRGGEHVQYPKNEGIS